MASRSLGPEVWEALSQRQRDRIRSAILDGFTGTLRPPRGSGAEIAWASARARGDEALVFLGLKYPVGVLKTRWTLVPSGGGWKVIDVLLSDPGVSVAAESLRGYGPHNVVRRDRAREARAAALPRAVGLLAIAAVVFGLGRRLSATGRRIVLVVGSAPAVLFVIDGALAVHRALSETYVVPEVTAPPAWSAHEREAVRAQREGRIEDARRAWQRAVAAGAPPAPADYQLGVALAAAGRVAEARESFLRALSRSPPAPGAERELALLALSEGDSREARDRLERYLTESGPDPDALSALAVARANLQEEGAVEAVEEATALAGDRGTDLRLQAQLFARAGDARRTVAALRALEAREPVDRERLRSDPAYLPIALEPEWIAFLSETPALKESP